MLQVINLKTPFWGQFKRVKSQYKPLLEGQNLLNRRVKEIPMMQFTGAVYASPDQNGSLSKLDTGQL